MGGHDYESHVAKGLTAGQAKRLFPDVNPKSIIKFNMVAGAYTISYEEVVNGVKVIRSKTIFKKAKKVASKKK